MTISPLTHSRSGQPGVKLRADDCPNHFSGWLLLVDVINFTNNGFSSQNYAIIIANGE